ncbi:DUF6455 family protein [Ruegeria sp.]|uniref:DUF6455 family protein n=1 Tax=Ruegeria sp. TaxID=1879320 RepID=UPI0023139BD3|nr:DUF6455 family protein [Ruegeria sp.]MDA7966085.1 DUF6455 family protein [Ruegeria sp.]
MSRQEILRHHAGLVDNMAASLGVDLEEAAIAGALRVDEISDAVLRCADCPNPGHCEAMLSQRLHQPDAPEYCRNRDLMGRLQP